MLRFQNDNYSMQCEAQQAKQMQQDNRLVYGLANQVPPPENALDQHEKSLSALVARLDNLCCRTSQLADRLFGAVPQTASPVEKRPSDPPVLRRLEILTDAGHGYLGALAEHLNRLERL